MSSRDKHIETIRPEQVREWVRAAIEQNRHVRRESHSRAAMDDAIEALYDDGETYLAASLLYLMSLRVLGREGLGLTLLMQASVDLARAAGPGGLERIARGEAP